MVEYYRIYNITKERGNVYGIYPHYNIHFIKDIQKHTVEEQIGIFEMIVTKNEWSTDDLVIAFGDNGTKIRYKCSTIDEYNPSIEEYAREKEIETYFEQLDIRKILQYANSL